MKTEDENTQTDSYSKTFWDTAQEAQKKLSQKYVNGNDGLTAFYKIRRLLEPYWKHEPPVAHPLTGRLLMASERNYERLTHLARKFEELATIAGPDFMWEKLGVAREYLGAAFEIDFILRLRHAGLPIRITRPGSSRIVDIESRLASREARIEITSHREDEQIYALKAFMAMRNAASKEGAILGGTLDRIPRSKRHISELVARIEEASKQANISGNTVTIDLPGKTFYLSPKKAESEIPEEFRELESGSNPPNKNKLYRTIREKAQRYSDAETLVIVVYDWGGGFSTAQTVEDYLKLDVRTIVEEFRNLACVILICPAFERLKSIRIDKGEVSYLEHSPKIPLEGKSERIIIWSNKRFDNGSIVEPIVESLTDAKPMRTPWLRFPSAG